MFSANAHLRALPCCSQIQADWLYAIRFASGIVKIGATRNPRCRALALQQTRRDRVEAVQLRRLPAAAHMHAEERAALARVRLLAEPLPGHREYFAGLAFDDAARALTPAGQEPKTGDQPRFERGREGIAPVVCESATGRGVDGALALATLPHYQRLPHQTATRWGGRNQPGGRVMTPVLGGA